MKLTLDYTQRLNLVGIMDGIEYPRREAWEICRLQHEIDLSDDEKTLIGYKIERTNDGRQYAQWNNNGHIKAKEFEFDKEDSKRIEEALDKHKVVLVRDRNWWIPLVKQFQEDIKNDASTTTNAARGMETT
jgi:hypothetical protein